MKEIRNMGALDRGLRALVVAPVAIVAAFAVGAGTIIGIVLFVVAAIMLATAATGFCPNYIWLGISTERGVHRVGHHIRHVHA
jgi:predicted lysophospholipase L1 biosynthesis ABC-type transport system permease subunit